MNKKKKNITARILAFSIAIILMFLSLQRCFYKIEDLLKTETLSTYNQTNEKLAVGVEKNIIDIFNVLHQCANDADNMILNGEDPQDIVNSLMPYTTRLYVKCINYLTTGGIAYCTDDIPFKITDSEILRNVVRQNQYISYPYMDKTFSDEELILFSKRISDKSENFNGSIFLNFRLPELKKYLSLNQYSNNGEMSMIIDEDFNSLFEKDAVQLQNYTDTISVLSNEDKTSLLRFKDGQLSTSLLLKNGDYIIVSPVRVVDTNFNTYVISIIKANAYMGKVIEARGHIIKMLTLTFLILGALLAYIFYLLIKRNKDEEAILRTMAFTDLETGGYNLQYFYQIFEEKNITGGFIVAIDVIHFTKILSLYPKQVSDKIINDLYEIIQNNISENDFVVHDQRDQYALYLALDNEVELERNLKALNNAFGTYATANGYPEIKAFFGIRKYDKQETVSYLYAEAQSSIKKKNERNKGEFRYALNDAEADNKRNEAINIFHKSLKENKFYLDYQPIFDAQTGRVNSAEAFVRYIDEKERVIYPEEYIHLLEETGHISDLDNYVFEKIVDFIHGRIEEKLNVVPISMNISIFTLYQKDIASKYYEYISSKGVDPKMVPLEIAAENVELNARFFGIIKELKNKGFVIQVDHIGKTGASLAILSNANFDLVKLDKSIVESVGMSGVETVMRHLAMITKELGTEVIAFGVSNKLQADFVKSLGVTSIQGPYYSSTVKENYFTEILDHYYESHLEDNVRFELLTRTNIIQTFESPIFTDEAISFMAGSILRVGVKEDKLYLMGANENAEKALELDERELLQNETLVDFEKLAYEDDCNILKRLILKSYETNRPVAGKLALRKKDFIIPVLCRVFAIREYFNYKEAYVFFTEAKTNSVDEGFADNIPGGLLIYKPNDNQKIIKVNSELLKIVGYENEEKFLASNNGTIREFIYEQDYNIVMNSQFVQFFSSENKQAHVRFRILKADGKLIYIDVQAKYKTDNIYEDSIYCYITSLEGQNEVVLNEENKVERLRYESTHDGLTGLYNQASVKGMARELFKNNPNSEFTLLVMDIDDFKQFNDKHGHAFGDTVIKTFASILRSCISVPGFCARIGGDEFVAIEPQSKETVEQIADRIYKKMHFTIGECVVTPSIGVTNTVISERNYEEMFLNSDIALYSSKNAGKDTYTIYSQRDEDTKYRKEESSGRVDTFDITRVVETAKAIAKVNGTNSFVYDFRAHKIHITDGLYKMFNFDDYVVDYDYLQKNIIFDVDIVLTNNEINSLANNEKDDHEVVCRWLDKTRNPIWIKSVGHVIKNGEKPLCLVGEIRTIKK